MRKIVYVIFALLIVIVGVAVYSVVQKRERMNPAVLQGQSEHWRVSVQFQPNGSQMVQAPVIEHLDDQVLDEVALSIVYKDQSSTKYPLADPTKLAPGVPYKPEQQVIHKGWKDAERAEVEWKSNGRRFKEYMNLENKSEGK